MPQGSINFSEIAKVAPETRRYNAGEAIFRKGDVGFELLIIKLGEVEIQVDERVLRTLQAGDIFGEMALVDDSTRSATAVALSDVEIVPISEKQFVNFIRQAPSFALDVMRVLTQRLREETMRS